MNFLVGKIAFLHRRPKQALMLVSFLSLLAPNSISATTLPPQEISKAIEQEIQDAIHDLYNTRWEGAFCVTQSPASWNHHLTRPMKKLFQIGTPAQGLLLGKLSDPKIRDQVIYLLGAIGDEKAIPAIINNMAEEEEYNDIFNPIAWKINLTANIALTNLTTADVFFPKGGGNISHNCSLVKSKSCWQVWWKKNESRFTIKNLKDEERMFQCYPNYGIYKVKQNTNSIYYEFDSKGKPQPLPENF